ncbi:MAG: hypothetical protein KJO69_10170, partial [Gammaproteobacteria bacterium]|nr:hypothetical protein [Gammaproteobacteria bacterium]
MSDWNVVAEINGGLPTGDGSLLTPWNGRPNIVWGGGGVFAGDTLNCLNSNGNFIDGDSLGASGLLNTPIIIDMTDAVMA